MLELQNGHIVCLNSVLALSAIPGAIDYCTSKASAFAFMESLTLGLLDCPGVKATTVLPFHTSTEMFQGMRVRSVGETSHLARANPAGGPHRKSPRIPWPRLALRAPFPLTRQQDTTAPVSVTLPALRKEERLFLRFTIRGYSLSW